MKPMKVSAGQAEGYYYGTDPVFSLSDQKWHGAGAEVLGLAGKAVEGEAFSALLRGYTPDGQHLAGKSNHADNAATDTILTAPKSVSIMMMQDPRLQDAMLRAAEVTAKSMEERGLIVGRQTQDGQTTEVEGKGVNALFGHSASRAGDPHAHVHAVWMNQVQRPDGTWSTLENNKIMQYQKETFQVFITELAANVRELGYSLVLVKTGAGMSFEIAGINRNEIELLSKRQEAIKNADSYRADLQERMPNASAETIDNLVQRQTRKEKNHDLTADDIRKNMREELALIGSSPEAIMERVQAAAANRTDKNLTAADIVRASIQDLTANESVITSRQILDTASRLAVGVTGREGLQDALEGAKQGLISYGNDKYTTVEMRDTQLSMARTIAQGQGQFESARTQEQAQAVTAAYLANGGLLTEGQKAATEAVLTNTDKMLIVQGVAGAGKSTMLGLVNQTLGSEINIIGLAPSAAAATQLEQSSGIKSQTVASFLEKDLPQRQDGQRNLIVVDEAGMLDTKSWSKLLEKAEQLNAQIVPVGDTEQFAAIGAGKEFSDWQKHDLAKVVVMDESVRQRSDYAKAVAQAAQSGDFKGAFQIMQESGKLHITDKAEALQAIAGRIAEGEGNTVFSVMSNAARTEIINSVDQIRGDERPGVTLRTATPVTLSEADKHYAGSYKTGNDVLITGDIEGMKKGERLTITGSNQEENSLTLTRTDGTAVELDVFKEGRNLSQYSMDQQTYHVGDAVMYTKNNNTKEGTELYLKNSMAGEVKSINLEAGTFVVENSFGKITQHREGDFITRADALTTYKTQGMTEQTAVAGVFNGDHASTNSLYVAMTRHKQDLEIYTDNPEQLLKDLQAQAKTSTLDHEKSELEVIKAEITGKKGEENSNDISALNGAIKDNSQAQTFDVVEYMEDKKQAQTEIQNHGAVQNQRQEIELSL